MVSINFMGGKKITLTELQKYVEIKIISGEFESDLVECTAEGLVGEPYLQQSIFDYVDEYGDMSLCVNKNQFQNITIEPHKNIYFEITKCNSSNCYSSDQAYTFLKSVNIAVIQTS